MSGPGNLPPDARTPGAPGGMSPRGITTPVGITEPELDYEDKKVLCSAMCKCQNEPNVGADGRSLKQACVSSRLKALDQVLSHQSPYKPEVTYDMSKRPPQPFLDKEVDTKGRELWPGWTKTLWPKDPERPQPYKAGKGYTARPDVVIVKDPTKPPTQDNIKQVVEMKFPGDVLTQPQETSYIKIAGDANKLVTQRLSGCDCNRPKREEARIPVDKLGAAAAMLGIIYSVVLKRPPPRGVPAY